MRGWQIILAAILAAFCLAAAPATRHAPDVVLLDELVSQYDPVPFDHQTHAAMAEMWDGCTTCHHRKPGSATNPVAIVSVEKSQADAAAMPACKDCHEREPAKSDLHMPSLKGAYHRQCLNCHREWANENACEVCHKARSAKRNPSVTPSVDDIAGRMHPPIAEPESKVYRARFTPAVGENIIFRHKEHTATYGIKCVSCHRRDNCSDCHNGQVSTIPHKPMAPGHTWKDSHAPCVGCHPRDRCGHCHYQDDKPAPPVFAHRTTGQVLDKDHVALKCGQCHANLRSKVGLTCGDAACHRADPSVAFPAKRPGPVVATQPAVVRVTAADPATKPTTRAVIKRIRQ